jgi:hypothetical protein
VNESVSLARFAVRALLAALIAVGLLFAAGHLGAGGIALMAVTEAAVIALLLRDARRPFDVPGIDIGSLQRDTSEEPPSGN